MVAPASRMYISWLNATREHRSQLSGNTALNARVLTDLVMEDANVSDVGCGDGDHGEEAVSPVPEVNSAFIEVEQAAHQPTDPRAHTQQLSCKHRSSQSTPSQGELLCNGCDTAKTPFLRRTRVCVCACMNAQHPQHFSKNCPPVILCIFEANNSITFLMLLCEMFLTRKKGHRGWLIHRGRSIGVLRAIRRVVLLCCYQGFPSSL